MSFDEYRARSRANWSYAAPGWERNRAFLLATFAPVSEWLVERIAPRPGQTVLELAAGPGDTGFLAAAQVGPEGLLLSTDFAADMVAAAGRRAEKLGLTNVEFRVLDAERMDLPDTSVDGVLCRWGYMLMVDPAAAFAETRRVLRPGGRVALAAWADPALNPWASLAGRAAVESGLMARPDPEEPNMFAFADAGRVRALVAGAGLEGLELETLELSQRFASFDEYWRISNECSPGRSQLLERLGDDEAAALTDRVRAAIEPYREGLGYAFPAATHVAAATAP